MEGLFQAMAISATALSAERLRLNVVAENLANVETTRTLSGGPYRRKLVVFAAEPIPFLQLVAEAGRRVGGVRVERVVESQSPPRMVYDPGHPDADAQGFVAMPNINPVLELVDLLAATRAYEANIAAIQAAKSMATKTLEIGR